MAEGDTVANHGAKLELACRCPTGLIRQRDADSALEEHDRNLGHAMDQRFETTALDLSAPYGSAKEANVSWRRD